MNNVFSVIVIIVIIFVFLLFLLPADRSFQLRIGQFAVAQEIRKHERGVRSRVVDETHREAFRQRLIRHLLDRCFRPAQAKLAKRLVRCSLLVDLLLNFVHRLLGPLAHPYHSSNTGEICSITIY